MNLIKQTFVAALSLAMFAAPLAAQETAETATEAPAVALVPDVVLGEADAPLTIIEYASFTCPHCATFHTEVLPKIKVEYIDTGKVKLIQRDVYFDPLGLWAGILARCGGDEKYYPISAMLYKEQSEWTEGETGEDIVLNLKKIGARAGISAEAADACWADEAMAERLVATFQANVTKDDVESTPSFMIDGEKSANLSWEEFKEVIDSKLAEVEG